MGLARWHAGALAYMGRDGIVVWQGERGKWAGVSMGVAAGLARGAGEWDEGKAVAGAPRAGRREAGEAGRWWGIY
jgi:hypothetical protein